MPLDGWLGPLVVLVAIVLGGLCLALVGRLEARRPAPPRVREGDGVQLARPRPLPLTPFERAMHGMAARWDDRTCAYVRDRNR